MSEVTKAYSKGYNAGKRRQTWYLDRIVEIARAYRARLQTTQQEHFGSANWMSRTCGECARWTRNPGCQWGRCGERFAGEVGEPNMWAEPAGHIFTQEKFGCVNWLHPDHPLRPPFVPART